MTKSKPPFRADVVGSFLRPERLKEARRNAGLELESTPDFKEEEGISLDQLRVIEDECIRELVDFEKQVGLQVATDGEFRRGSWAYDSIGRFEGVELRRLADGAAFAGSGFQPPVAHTDSKISRQQGGIVLHDYLFLKNLTDRTIKVTVPSPTLFYVRGGREAVNDEVYPDIEEFFEDLTQAYRDEIQDLSAAGSTYLQIDNTDAAMLCDPKFQEAARSKGLDPKDQIALQGKLVSMATRDRPDNMTISMHMCRGNNAGAWLAEGSYDFVAEALFTQFDVDAFFMEYDSERAGDFSPLRFAQKDTFVVLGLVTTKTPENDSKDVLLRRIEEASAYIPIENLALSPQCGFASVARGNPITFDDQKRKLELILKVVDEVWGTS